MRNSVTSNLDLKIPYAYGDIYNPRSQILAIQEQQVQWWCGGQELNAKDSCTLCTYLISKQTGNLQTNGPLSLSMSYFRIEESPGNVQVNP